MYVILLLILLLTYLFHKYVNKCYNYWKDLGVPYEEPCFFFGSLKDIFFGRKHIDIVMREIYRKHDGPYVGIYRFTQPQLLIRDCDLARDILVKDFEYFQGNDIEVIDRCLRNHPFLLIGEEWKKSRNELLQCLSSAKLKSVMPTMQKIADEFVDYIANFKGPVEAKNLCTRYAIQNTVNIVFGLDAGCLQLNDVPTFVDINRKIFYPSTAGVLKQMCIMFFPILSKFIGVRFMPKDVDDYMFKLITKLVKDRKENGTQYGTLMDVLLENNSANDDYNFEKILAHVFSLYTDSTETSAHTISYMLYEMALNLGVQNKLRNEIETVKAKYDGILTYEALQDLTYFDCVLNETLRMHSPGFVMGKKCTRDYTLPALNKNDSKNITLKAGTSIYIPVYSFHHDENYFPEPERFDPDRFSEENKNLIVKGSYLPFSLGQRHCIGARYAKLQIKMALIALLSTYEIRVNDKTVKPIEFDPKVILLMLIKGGMWLEFHKISK